MLQPNNSEIVERSALLSTGQGFSFAHQCIQSGKHMCLQQMSVKVQFSRKFPGRFFRVLHDKELDTLWVVRLR